MRKIVVFLAFLVLSFGFSVAQNDFRVMFYNVENLFDTKKDFLKNDDEFVTGGALRWNDWKYWEKLRNITRVITAVGGMQSPALVGLCEVENDSVIFDLTRRSPLRAQDYEYVMTNSPDRRGIDVALLYQPYQFKLFHHQEYEIIFRDRATRPTRNILHATGRVMNGDTIDVFVCHFPSRSGGQRETEPARVDAATMLRAKVDSLFILRERANIIIMGDFNDHPNDRSIFQTLKARSINYHRSDKELYNLFFHRIKERDFGTYAYQGRWEILDQLIVSGNLLTDSSSIKIKNKEAHVFNPDFLLETDKLSGKKRPYRTHLGPRYVGGFSDHLPVYLDLVIQY